MNKVKAQISVSVNFILFFFNDFVINLFCIYLFFNNIVPFSREFYQFKRDLLPRLFTDEQRSKESVFFAT